MKIIKRYANRKLYDTDRSCYVTLDEIAQMVRDGEALKIIDQKTEEDLTGVTLAQIVFEEQKRSRRFIPLPALEKIIQTGGEFLQRISQPVQQFREDTQRSMDRIWHRSEIPDEGRQTWRDYANTIQRAIDELQKRVDERIRDAIDTLTHLPQIEKQLEELHQRLDAQDDQLSRLQQEVERLSNRQHDQ